MYLYQPTVPVQPYFPPPSPLGLLRPYPAPMNVFLNVFPSYPQPLPNLPGRPRPSPPGWSPARNLTPNSRPTSGPQVRQVPRSGEQAARPRGEVEEEKQENSGQRQDEDPPNEDESLSKIQDTNACKRLFKGRSYKYRNVYKSIMRNMHACLRKNREVLSNILMREGYTLGNIEHAYYKIDSYHDSERSKGKKKVAQTLIQKMLAKKTIYTHILQEALNAMIHNTDQGKLGRVDEKNFQLYSEVCSLFYEQTVQILGTSAQANALAL